ncbi:MAG: hypothetical protein L0209_12475, partial [candidate division Zixibacteria bacterium]|nr:hypothetical protein [candidate division Zixibacteria bacterium]
SGARKISTETGAGQWGTALAFACSLFGLESEVYMVRASYDQKPYRRTIMEMYGATVYPSPSNNTNYGRKLLEEDPDTPGSLGIAISEAVEVAATNEDVKSLVAFSSVSHLGFVTLGLLAMNLQGWQGGMLQMLNHGVSTGALFLLVGMIYERRHTRLIDDFGGLTKVMPIFAVFFMIITLSSIGLPGTNGFVGEFLILVGTFRANPVWAAFATTGVILAAVYMLWMFQRVMQGEVKNPANAGLADLSWREKAVLVPPVVFVFWIGVYPNTFLKNMEGSLENLLNQVNRRETVLRTLPAQSWSEFMESNRSAQSRASLPASNVP